MVMSDTNTKREIGLRANSVPLLGLVAQSVAAAAPSFAIFLAIGLNIGIAGNGAWLSFLIAMAAVLPTALCIRSISKRVRTPGGLYGLSARVGGSAAGVFAGWGALLYYLLLGLVAFIGSGLIAVRLLNMLGVSVGSWFVLVVGIVILTGAAFVAYKGVELSAKIMLYVELACLGAIFVLMMVALFNSHGSPFDGRQLTLKGASTSGVIAAVVLSVASFAGFESSATLGIEAKDASRAVGIAAIGSVIVIGIAFVGSAYITTLGFQYAGKSAAASPDPLSQLAGIAGVPWIRYIVVIGVMVGAFSFGLASLNATSRFLYTLAQERFLPRWVGGVSPRTGTPSRAISMLAVGYFLTLVAFEASGSLNIDQFLNAATLFGYGAMLLYFVTCLSYIKHRYSLRDLRVQHIFVGILGAAVMVYVIYRSAVPSEPPPGNYLLYTFFGVIGLALLHYIVLLVRRSPTLKTLGTTVEETSTPG